MKVDMDGNALCVMHDDFINLAESPAFFVELTPGQIKEFNEFVKG